MTRRAAPPADDRDLIRTALDETLLVEAAAGTGKTTQLVARIVRLIQTGRARVTGIVAVTFSEKAAGELKLRLREELERARVDPGTGADESRRLDDAVLEFEEAHISTIHGFCAELLRERPVEARIDPAFAVLTEGESVRLFDEAFAGWLEAALQEPGEGVRRALRRPRAPTWWRDADEEDGPTARLRRAGLELLQWRDHPAPWKRPDWDRPATIDRVVESVLDVAAMTETPISTRDVLFLDTTSLRRQAGEIARAARQSPRDYDGLEALVTTLAGERDLAKTRKGSGAMYSTTRARQTILDARAALLAALKTFRDVANADLAALVHAELQDCVRRYEDRKQRAGKVDFLDLLIRARDLVRDCPPVRAAFCQRFTFILVDEFQDTDPVQAELLMLLASDAPPASSLAGAQATTAARTRTRPGALFVVGDPKQSIYRFRRADIGMYQRICDELTGQRARRVVLKQSFRSVPNLQRFVNAAFRDAMARDDAALQPGYVELVQHRPDTPEQPSLIALPVPRPYGRYQIAKSSIERSLPDAIGEFVRWLVRASGWVVTTAGQPPRPVRASDVCLLFRRFIAYQDDITRKYVEALESRGVPHLLVGGKTFHEREEVDAMRTALSAIEWPEDELSVFATLRGPLFALGEEELFEYHARARERSPGGHAFHPYHPLDALPPHLAPIGEALDTLRGLHAGRNYRPVADTIGRLIDATRAHAGFMLWQGGEQVLANVLHIAELARQYESEGGLSFRGFVDTLRAAADQAQAPEAPILEEGSEGVRLMTVHKAKGLEFPVVILADITCGLSRADAQRYLDSSRGLCAIRLAGWAPLDLIEHNDLEARRDAAEGVRLAYVAATRARDMLVVPAVGDGPFNDGWVSPLNAALYPPVSERSTPPPAAGTPPFAGKDTVLERPDGALPSNATVRPGQYADRRPGRRLEFHRRLVGPGPARPAGRRRAGGAARRSDREGRAAHGRGGRSRSCRGVGRRPRRRPGAGSETLPGRGHRDGMGGPRRHAGGGGDHRGLLDPRPAAVGAPLRRPRPRAPRGGSHRRDRRPGPRAGRPRGAGARGERARARRGCVHGGENTGAPVAGRGAIGRRRGTVVPPRGARLARARRCVDRRPGGPGFRQRRRMAGRRFQDRRRAGCLGGPLSPPGGAVCRGHRRDYRAACNGDDPSRVTIAGSMDRTASSTARSKRAITSRRWLLVCSLRHSAESRT